MKTAKFLPAALLMTTMGVFGMAYAQESGDAPHKDPARKEWGHHHHEGMWSALPEEKRKLLKDTMEKVHKENAPLKEQARKVHAELDALMVAPQFDSDAFLKKTAEAEDLHNKMKENGKKAFASILGQFTQEERIELVVMQHLKKQMKHHHWHHDDGKMGHHPMGGMPPHGDGNPPPPAPGAE